jgi:alpha-1,2-mannosyltransferase
VSPHRASASASWHRALTRPGRWLATPATAWVVGACVLVAVLGDAFQLSRPGYLLGSTADISVYLAAAVRLVHGALPYRDFVLVQPPGMALLLSPAAFLSDLVGTRDALAAVRLGTVLIAALNVLLVGRLLRHRGRLAVLVGCGFMAVSPGELYALNDGLLEPVVDLLCLVGAVLVFDGGGWSPARWRWVLGGVALGFAVTVKLPAAIPALVLLALGASDPRRRLLPWLAGAAGGAGLPVAGFLAAAPGAMVNDVVLSQLARVPGGARVPVTDRLAAMTLLDGGTAGVAVTMVVLAIIVAGFAAGVVVAGRRRDSRPVAGPTPRAAGSRPERLAPVEWFAAASGLLLAAAQFVPSQYYPQYPAQLAPFLALSLGASVDLLTAVAIRRRAGAARIGAVVTAAVAVLLGLAAAAQGAVVAGRSVDDPSRAVDAVVPPAACTLSDGPTNLVPSDRLVVATPGCSEMIDTFGTMLAYQGDPAGGLAALRDAIDHTDYLVVDHPAGQWLTGGYAPLLVTVASQFHLVRSGSLWIYVRDGYPVG